MYDEEIEKVVLYYVIFEHTNLELSEQDFVNTTHRKIIKAIHELKTEKADIGIVNITNKMKNQNPKILSYLATLGDYALGTSAQKTYDKLIEYSKKRQLNNLLLEKTKENKETREKTDILIEKIIKQLKEIQQRNKKMVTLDEQIIESMAEVETNYKNRSDYSLYTGLIGLDKKMLGLHRRELTVIGARPGIGKTTLALQIANHIARKGLHVGVISLEMAETQLLQKMVSRISKINGYKLRAGTLVEDDFTKIVEAYNVIRSLSFHITSSLNTIQDIETKTRQLKNEKQLDLLIIDYLQLIRNEKNFSNREQEVADISRTLKLLSLELNIPIVALCQLNRNATINEPTLADLRESGAIEQDADNVIFLYQEDGQEDSLKPIIIAKIAKQRAGVIGKVRLQFNKENSEFLSLI